MCWSDTNPRSPARCKVLDTWVHVDRVERSAERERTRLPNLPRPGTASKTMHTAPVRGRKRKTQHPFAWDPSNEVRANMPRASGMLGVSAPIVKRPYANIIYGREQDEDVADALVGAFSDTYI